jgi:hypothetical protein
MHVKCWPDALRNVPLGVKGNLLRMRFSGRIFQYNDEPMDSIRTQSFIIT